MEKEHAIMSTLSYKSLTQVEDHYLLGQKKKKKKKTPIA